MEPTINNNFSFARLWKYTWANIYINRITLILSAVAMFVCINMLYGWIVNSEWIQVGGADMSSLKIFSIYAGFVFLTVPCWIIMTANLLSIYHKKGGVSRSFLLPVSQTEQWLSHILFSWGVLLSLLLIQTLIFAIWIGGYNFAESFSERNSYLVQNEWFDGLFSLRYHSFQLFSWALFLYIGTLFTRKRILISILAWCVLTYLISYTVSLIYGSFFSNGDVSLDYAYSLERIVSIIQLILSVAFVALSYYRYKKLQINR